jgi:hypothetical protein
MSRPMTTETAVTLARFGLLLGCIGSLAIMAGCVSTPDRAGAFDFARPEGRNAQLALTGLMAIDTAQTVTIGRSPDCLREGNPLASAVFGTDRPSPERVLLTNAVYMTGHWLLGAYLDRKANAPIDLSVSAEADIAKRERFRWLKKIYHFATGLGHGVAVARNQAIGIKPFSTFECGAP